MRRPGKLKKWWVHWVANKFRRKYTPLSQVGEVLRENVEHPALLKWLSGSDVGGGYLLSLRVPFCRAHLPADDVIMVLETESGDRYETKYLYPGRLSGGWKRFAIDMKLKPGDGVVFHLVEPTKFKVYFIQPNSANEVHLHINSLNLVIQQSAITKEDINQLSIYNKVGEEVLPTYLKKKQRNLNAYKFSNKGSLHKAKLKILHADKIRRKYLPFFQVSRKWNLVDAKRIQSKLNGDRPVIVEWLKTWNVFHHPSLVFPRPFCIAHLPLVDTVMVLETDTGERYKVKYLPRMGRLSAGWAMFAKKMKLEPEDAIVFHLVEPAKFKVYILRVSSTKEARLPFHLRSILFHAKRSISSTANSSWLSFYKAREINHKYLQGKQKNSRADKIRSKELAEVIGNGQLAYAKKLPIESHTENLVTVKWLIKSNVQYGGSVVLKPSFCRAHLPSVDTIMVLETEIGEQYETKYLSRSYRLSGGWSSFAMNMELERGDGVVFHLVEATKFKVYIIRANSADEVRLPPHIHDLVYHKTETVSRNVESNQLTVYKRGHLHKKISHGVQKESKADEFWRKKLHRSQVLGKSCMVQSKMVVKHPVTVKWLQKSYMSGVFILPLPTQFCRVHLPLDDTTMELETEVGEIYDIKYLAQCSSLSGGWRRFAMDKKLEAGDAVIFHLVEDTKFKVYIVRADSKEVNLPVHLFRLLTDVRRRLSFKTDSKYSIVYSRGKEQQAAESKSWESARLNSTEGSVLLPEVIDFSSITSFEEFKAVLHELHELPNHILHDYYKLCCNQKAFLHARLFRGINPRFNKHIIVRAIRRIILNTVDLADALSTCKLSTFLRKYALWNKTLKTYLALGMNVSFLCDRLDHLKNLAVNLEGATERAQYEDACHERRRAQIEVSKLKLILAKLQKMQRLKLNLVEENYKECSWMECAKAEISHLETLITELRKVFAEYDAHIELLKLKTKTHELKFNEEVTAPWLDCLAS